MLCYNVSIISVVISCQFRRIYAQPQQLFTSSKPTIGALEKVMKYAQVNNKTPERRH